MVCGLKSYLILVFGDLNWLLSQRTWCATRY